MKVQKEKLSSQFQEIVKDRETVQEKKQELHKNQKEQEKRLRAMMENYIKDEQQAGVRD